MRHQPRIRVGVRVAMVFAVLLGLLGLTFATPLFANEATRTSVCIRINRSGELVSTTIYKEAAQIRSREAIAAIQRAAMPSFPPLPDGAPEFVDFHWEVVCGCTGYIYGDNMRLCKHVHQQEAQMLEQ